MGNTYSDHRKCRSLPNSPNVKRQAVGNGKNTSNIPQPGSAILVRKAAPEKNKGQTGLQTSSITITNNNQNVLTQPQSLIPRVPNATQSISLQKTTNSSMLDRIKLFKSSDKNGLSNKRTSSSSGVSSSNRSEKSDESVSSLIEQNLDSKSASKTTKIKQRALKAGNLNQSQPASSNQKLIVPNYVQSNRAGKDQVTVVTNTNMGKSGKIAADVEKHAQKVANLATSKIAEPKVKLSGSKVNLTTTGDKLDQVSRNSIVSLSGSHSSVNQLTTGIPKPTAPRP